MAKIIQILQRLLALQILLLSTSILLCTCVVQLTTLGDFWQPKVLRNNWPSCIVTAPNSGGPNGEVHFASHNF